MTLVLLTILPLPLMCYYVWLYEVLGIELRTLYMTLPTVSYLLVNILHFNKVYINLFSFINF